MDSTHEIYMNRCLELARLGEGHTAPNPMVGCVIVHEGKIIGEGFHQRYGGSHAEVNAIRIAASLLKTFDLSGCVIYSSCEPCPMCLGAIYWARLDKLFFAATRTDAQNAGFSDALIYSEINLPIYERTLHTEHVSIENAEFPFEEWKNLMDKIPY